MNIAIMLLNEMDEFGITLLNLITNNKKRLADNPTSEYLLGKIDAYEVAYEDYIRRLKKVNSYTSHGETGETGRHS